MNSDTTVEPMVSSRTRRQKVEDREQAIIAAASELFNGKGYAKTTIADIAAASGVADGTVYLYFKNKEALARGVLANFYNELTVKAQSGVDALSTSRERIRFLARHHLTQVVTYWRLLEMLPLINMSMTNYSGSDLYKMNKAYTEVFDRVVKDSTVQGHINPSIPAWVLRDQFYGAMDYGAKTIMMRGSQTGDIDSFVSGLVELLLPQSPTSAVEKDNPALSRLEQVTERLEAAAKRLEPPLSRNDI